MTSVETDAKIKKYKKESIEGLILFLVGIPVSLFLSSMIGYILIIVGLCYFFIRRYEMSKIK